jgi:Na+-transporting NADH:ubiquinone oxidoreductase subunit F
MEEPLLVLFLQLLKALAKFDEFGILLVLAEPGNQLDLDLDDLFSSSAKKHNNFTYHVALSDPLPSDNWDGLTGFIHQCLYDEYLAEHPDPTEIEYYLCGPPMMIDAIIDMLDNLGVDPESIFYDKF